MVTEVESGQEQIKQHKMGKTLAQTQTILVFKSHIPTFLVEGKAADKSNPMTNGVVPCTMIAFKTTLPTLEALIPLCLMDTWLL